MWDSNVDKFPQTNGVDGVCVCVCSKWWVVRDASYGEYYSAC